MSDQNPRAIEAQSKPEASISHLNSARPARLLFGRGEAGWAESAFGQYTCLVGPPKGQNYTERDYQRCLELLDSELNIKPISSCIRPHMMRFVISSGDMDLLRQDGIGKTSAGRLLSFDKPVIADHEVMNDPMAMLRENLRQVVYDWDAWTPPQKNKLLVPHRQCDVVLPMALLEELATVAPSIHNNPEALSSLVGHVLESLLNQTHVEVSCSLDESGALLNLSVKSKYYRMLDAAIKQQPSTNVTSITCAEAKREAGIGEGVTR